MAIDTNFSDGIKQNQILQIWFSSSFPIGSFAYSHGLEAMIDNKYIIHANAYHMKTAIELLSSAKKRIFKTNGKIKKMGRL